MSITPRPPQIIPYVVYRDIGAALDFLTRAFGFKEEMRVGTPSGGMHGEATFQGQLVMMGQGAHERSLKTPKDVGAATMGVFIYLDDVDKHYEVANAAGAPDLLGERSRGTSLVLHEPAEGRVTARPVAALHSRSPDGRSLRTPFGARRTTPSPTLHPSG
jgi:Glyoxalase/Bleomycin resistance protein/Dioxygenase superfamily